MEEGSSSLPQVNHPRSCRCLVRKMSPIGTRSHLASAGDPAPDPAVADNESSTAACPTLPSHIDASSWHRSKDHPRSYNDSTTHAEDLVAPSLSRSSTWELITPGLGDSTVKVEEELNASDETCADATTTTTTTNRDLTQLIQTLGNQLESLNTTDRPLVQGSPHKATTTTTGPVITGKGDPRFESAILSLAQSLILHHHSTVTPELVSPINARTRLQFAFENLVELGLEMAQIEPTTDDYARKVVEDLYPLDRRATGVQESVHQTCSSRPRTESSTSTTHRGMDMTRVIERHIECTKEQVQTQVNVYEHTKQNFARMQTQLDGEVAAREKLATTNRLILARLNHLDSNTSMQDPSQLARMEQTSRELFDRLDAKMDRDAKAREGLAMTNRLLLARLNHLESRVGSEGRGWCGRIGETWLEFDCSLAGADL